jgi:hypothetical protein
MKAPATVIALALVLSGCASYSCSNGNTWNLWTGCRTSADFSFRPSPAPLFAHSILRDPVSGQTVNCTLLSQYNSGPAFGRGGAIGAGLADGLISGVQEANCVNNYRAAGFVPVW